MWKATGRHLHPIRGGDPTPPPWEAERIRDNLARDLEYLERQVPPFLRRTTPGLPSASTIVGPSTFEKSSSSSKFLGEKSSSSGFQSGSKTTSTLPSGGTTSTGLGSGGGGGGEVVLRPGALPLPSSTLGGEGEGLPYMMSGGGGGDMIVFGSQFYSNQMIPQVPYRTLPPRTYENWPRRESTPPIYAMARSPSFDIDERITTTSPSGRILTGGASVTVPVSEASPGQRTLMDMSVDDPYEFDPVIPDTSPEIVYPSSTQSTSTSRFKRTRDRERDMEARVAAMKEEFFEYRRRQKKRMESAC
jgi:hypothetical protein